MSAWAGHRPQTTSSPPVRSNSGLNLQYLAKAQNPGSCLFVIPRLITKIRYQPSNPEPRCRRAAAAPAPPPGRFSRPADAGRGGGCSIPVSAGAQAHCGCAGRALALRGHLNSSSFPVLVPCRGLRSLRHNATLREACRADITGSRIAGHELQHVQDEQYVMHGQGLRAIRAAVHPIPGYRADIIRHSWRPYVPCQLDSQVSPGFGVASSSSIFTCGRLISREHDFQCTNCNCIADPVGLHQGWSCIIVVPGRTPSCNCAQRQ